MVPALRTIGTLVRPDVASVVGGEGARLRRGETMSAASSYPVPDKPQKPDSPPAEGSERNQRKAGALGLTSATGLVVGSIIGTGVFTMSLIGLSGKAALGIRPALRPDGYRERVPGQRWPDPEGPVPVSGRGYQPGGAGGHGRVEAGLDYGLRAGGAGPEAARMLGSALSQLPGPGSRGRGGDLFGLLPRSCVGPAGPRSAWSWRSASSANRYSCRTGCWTAPRSRTCPGFPAARWPWSR
jgi:hypothetical protein